MGPGGYRWWYVDGLSECGSFALTVIAFVGSVFSPYYAWRGRREPENHVALNVCLYCAGSDRWAMTERGRHCLERSSDRLRIGPSTMHWQGGELVIDIDEVAIPRPPQQFLPERLRGSIRVRPRFTLDQVYPIDGNGRHVWRPVAPVCDISVDFGASRGRRWSGNAYVDGNWGSEPLERGFERWDWARGMLGDGRAVVLYQARQSGGGCKSIGLMFEKGRAGVNFEAPPQRSLGKGFWGVERLIACDPGQMPVVLRTLEDSPFYVRSLVQTRLGGEDVTMVNESFDGGRFASPIVKAMLPFRMPRRAG